MGRTRLQRGENDLDLVEIYIYKQVKTKHGCNTYIMLAVSPYIAVDWPWAKKQALIARE